MKPLKHLPNLITCLNLLCGCLSLVFANKLQYDLAAYFILLGAILDFFDGFAARLLNSFSNIGKDLDSLSDVITFGVSPAFLLFQFITFELDGGVLAYSAFLIPIFSALRLARYNQTASNDDSTDFEGLPTPACGLFFAFLPILALYLGFSQKIYLSIFPWLFPLFSALMISKLSFFSLKSGKKDNSIFKKIMLIILVMMGIIGNYYYSYGSISIVLFLYVFLSLIYHFVKKKQHSKINIK